MPPVQPAEKSATPIQASQWLEASRALQGLPVEVSEPEAVMRLAHLLLKRRRNG